MNNTLIAILVTLVSAVVSMIVYPKVFRFAKTHHIVDNPNARKLQRVPVPVLGGMVVYVGILAGVAVLCFFMTTPLMGWGLFGMTIMMAIGTWDDIHELPASFRFLIEIGLVTAFIFLTGVYVDGFHGLWGIYKLPEWLGVLSSIVAGVGLINAVNLIDGVDGYSSGYGMLACTCFGIMFWSTWSPIMVCITLIVVGALIPFFMHNVFGVKSKMFIGDGGTLMLGMLITMLVFSSLSSKSQHLMLENEGVGLIAFALAVTCIPVFDTLRVMTMRILRGTSPFKPDKTHLHHLFVDMEFSHLGAALVILALNGVVVVVWYLLWKLGASIDVQFYVVFSLGILITFGFYKFMKVQQNGGPKDAEGYPQGTRIWHAFCRFGNWTHREKKLFWIKLRLLMDGPLMGNKEKS